MFSEQQPRLHKYIKLTPPSLSNSEECQQQQFVSPLYSFLSPFAKIELGLDNHSICNLDNGKWKKYGYIWNEVMQWQVEILNVDTNQGVLNNIARIRFPNLKMLHLGHNSIQSLDLLSNMYCPQLNNLNLSSNNITSIKTLKFLHTSFLLHLDLSHNKIYQLHTLSQLKFNDQITTVELQLANKPNILDMTLLLKCSFKNLKYIRINHFIFNRVQFCY